MKFTSNDYFHGAPVAAIKSIIATGELRPNANKEIFLSRFSWTDSLKFGADSIYGGSFVAAVRVEVPDGCLFLAETHGVKGTAIIRTDKPVPATITSMFVRWMDEDRESPAKVVRLPDLGSIQAYLASLAPRKR